MAMKESELCCSLQTISESSETTYTNKKLCLKISYYEELIGEMILSKFICPLLERVYSKRKEFAPKGSK